MARKAKVDNAILKRLERTERKRKEAVRNIRQYILIVCEGEKTEPLYFEGFKNDLPPGVLDNNWIEISGTGTNTLSLIQEVERVRTRRERETGRSFDQVWAVFDKDDFPSENFNNAIFKAQEAFPEIQCAWTNEAFELWYCLHFCYVNHAMPREDYRKAIERELTQATGQAFTYRKNHPEMFSLLKQYGDEERAIKWAKKLAESYGDRSDFAYHNPRTGVHLLVEAITQLADQ